MTELLLDAAGHRTPALCHHRPNAPATVVMCGRATADSLAPANERQLISLRGGPQTTPRDYMRIDGGIPTPAARRHINSHHTEEEVRT